MEVTTDGESWKEFAGHDKKPTRPSVGNIGYLRFVFHMHSEGSSLSDSRSFRKARR